MFCLLLLQIYNGAETAKGNARSATEGIQGLNDRLDNLKKKYASNKFKIDNAENESRSAKELAEQASRVSFGFLEAFLKLM